MSRETYPLPGPLVRPPVASQTPEFGVDRAAWEERVFRNAAHFNVVRFKGGGACGIATVKTFGEAVRLAHNQPRHIIYVAGKNGEAFCMSPKDHAKYALITVKMREKQS